MDTKVVEIERKTIEWLSINHKIDTFVNIEFYIYETNNKYSFITFSIYQL